MRNYTTTGFDQALCSQSGKSAVITLNRPKVLNSLSLDMVRYLTPLYNELNNNPDVANIVLKGVGKAFCAGGDIVQIYDSGLAKKRGENSTVHEVFFREEYILDHVIGTLKTPHIAILNGITMGGGVGLSVHGHFRVATENTLFAMPETGIGFFPDVGGSYFLPRLKGGFGTFLALTGHRLKAHETVALGIATHYVESGSLPKLEAELSTLTTKDTAAVKRVLDKHSAPLPSLDSSEIFKEEALIHSIFTQPSLDAIVKELEKKKDTSALAKKTLENFTKGTLSPTSLAVAFKQMQHGKNLSFRDCFIMEYKISQAFMHDNDFFEGVRALLVDKTKDPKWKPTSLKEIDQAKVDAYFKFPAEMNLSKL